jgi:hypothetical protein
MIEYEVLDIADLDPAQLKAKLNELGKDRWEVVCGIEDDEGTTHLVLKRP